MKHTRRVHIARADGARTEPAGPPWRYLLTGAPLDARARRVRESGDRRSSAAAQIAVSVLARLIVSTMRARFEISLSGELPGSGCVLVSHHDSYWDGVMAVALDPRVVPITSARWRSIRFVGWVLDSYGVLWTGEQAVAGAIALIQRGCVCWVAPHAFERGATHPAAHLGAARICVGAHAPAVPVKLSGLSRSTRAPGPRGRAQVSIGSPVWPHASESAEEFSARLKQTLPPGTY